MKMFRSTDLHSTLYNVYYGRALFIHLFM